MHLTEKPIETWDTFLAVFGQSERDILFRGQSKECWSLVPSFQRNIPDPNDLKRVKVFEEEVLRRFQTQAPALLSPAIVHRLQLKLEWWAVMQHHNVSTRLLDWTHCPLVAAYFAVSENLQAAGAIWSIDVDLVQRTQGAPHDPGDIEEGLNEVDQPLMHFTVPGIQTERMSTQQTVFSVATRVMQKAHNAYLTGLLYDVPDNPDRPLAFAKHSIPARAKLEFLENLRQLDVTPATLFPGIDGLGRAFAERIRDRFLADESVENRTLPGAPPIPW